MEKISRLSAEQRSDLIAYLDGELDERASQEVEQALARSAVARHEVDVLSRTWDMLNLLPRPKASGEFTQKTVASLKTLDIPRTPVTAQAWFRAVCRGLVVTGWAAGLACAAWLGFQATHRLVPNEADQLLEDLPVISEFDQYTEVGSIDFLRELKKSGILKAHDAKAD